LWPLSFRVGLAGASYKWDTEIKRLILATKEEVPEAVDGVMGPSSMEGVFLPGPYGQNVWEDATWCGQIPKPDRSFNLANGIKKHRDLEQLFLPQDLAILSQRCLEGLSELQAARSELQALYDAYNAYQAQQRSQA